ncbi:hypothetical protein PG994_009294 [Apiospora phragmitis]|uniref:Uncharacterized protein n=1 Tax=Apiospora phragmitis TaxID=2905665 RepID=A0ABR1UIW1_9PEZI
MTAPGAGAESFRDNIQAIVSEAVGKRLRHEGLDTLDKERDEALRQQIPKNVKAFVWFTEQNQLYDAKCREYLEHVRPELHHAIDTLIDSLEGEFLTGSHGQIEAVSLRTPQTPRSASTGFPIRQGQVGTFGPSQPRAPEAAMDALSGRAISPSRSATMLAEDPRPAAHRGVPADFFINSDHDVPSDSDRTPKRSPISLAQVKPDECVFRYKDLPGFYVLRCNNRKCKKKHHTTPFYFQAHPFQWNRALNHFVDLGHNTKQDDRIFKIYAHEVSDATEERNLKSPKARQSHTPKTPNSELPGPSDVASSRPAAAAPLTPASPSTSRDKGKQPVSLAGLDIDDDDHSSFAGEDAEGPLSSGSAVAEALSRSQPYPTRNRVSIPDEEVVEIDEDSDQDDEETNLDMEFPPLANWSKSARRYAPA